MILAVVEKHAAERVVDAVVQVVAQLATADCLADDLGEASRGGSDKETAGFGEDLDWLRKKAVQFGGDGAGQAAEGRDRAVVVGRKAAADVQELQIEAAR